MIKVDIRGLESLVALSEKLSNFHINVLEVIAQELEEFAESLKNIPDIEFPSNYKDALYVGILESYDTVVLTVAVPKRYAYERFGTRKEWAMYYCKRRKYAGGTVVPEYTIIKYIKERWEEYKNEFVSRVKSRLQEVVGR